MINQPPQPQAPYQPPMQPYGQPYGQPPQPQPKRRLSLRQIQWLIILGILVIGGIGFGIFTLVRTVEADPFKNNLAEYVKEYSFGGATDPYVHGKIVVVNKSEKKIDDPYFDLPADIKATKPEEVGTIVQVDFVTNQVGTYGSKGKAYKYRAYVTVIDKSTGKMVGKTSFDGGEPPSSVKSGNNGYGSKPTEDIKKYLVGLPHQ